MANENSVSEKWVRENLLNMLKTRKMLREFCARHDLSYNYVYRVAKGYIKSMSHTKALELSRALHIENPPIEHKKDVL